jgi:LysM repeat protein
MSGWGEDSGSDEPDEWIRPARDQPSRRTPQVSDRPAEGWGRDNWAQDDWPEESWSYDGGTQPRATYASGRTSRIDDFADEPRFATPPPRYGGAGRGVRRPGGPGGPQGSGLPPTLPTIPTILVAVTAVIVAFVFGHSTGGGDSSTAATTPEVVVATTVPPTTLALESYTVAKGDTLASIATRFGVTADAIAAANAISDPSRIFIGQVLKIPAPGSATPTPASTTTTKAR